MIIRKRITILIGLTALLSFFISYERAKKSAVKYLQIVTIHDEESFQRVKNEIYDIVSPEVRKVLFDKGKYEGGSYSPITYKVNSVRGYIKGCNHYIFKINWTSNGYYTINSVICIKDGIVYDTYRVD
ncbi:MAG: hypothetical protein N4A64_09000 [Marinisporobacter sp.]|jgi:hypothetical protein|nr:hypothetical protein [Marinisporobacter sp.]